MYIYLIVATLLLAMELVYFKVAEKLNIIDKPNARSSHSLVVLRGGGIIFLLGTWMWSAFFGFQYPWFLLAITLVAGVSFIDDIRSLPDSVRLIAHFVAMALMFYQIGILQWELWWVVLIGDCLRRCHQYLQFYGWDQRDNGRLRYGCGGSTSIT